MFIDAFGLLSNAQAFTVTAVSTNTIDLGDVTPKRDIGAGEPMEVVIAVDVAADVAEANETYQADFIQSANADLSSPDVLVSRVIAGAALTAGSVHHLPIPPGAITKRYIGLRLTLGGTTPTITVTAFLQPQSMSEKRKDYADALTIS